ncbi:MAG: glycosyltransferase family 9 protein [Verrucomicrobia bacterium]|jgi:ADP-heptose:LPS heptosyltransferase|nr:glycosyltransferase family 9 protein [Verrucomicrobiota bacterium]MBT7067960.1 glycosyltransferase family 9 protein [Verrucomicrobiota bacterium]MBT7699923.1 glycosyltransferase family 9 protein [Verrucomicrobiota bacterium]
MVLGSGSLKTLDAGLGPLLCGVLTRPNGHDVPLPDSVQRILVLRPGGMGDMLLLLPMLDALHARYPAAVIDLLCEQRNVEVIELAKRHATPLLYDQRPLRTLRHLRRHAYDLAIDTEQFHHFSAVMAVLSGSPLRIGFKINPRRNPLYTHLVNYSLDAPEASQFLRLLEPLGIKAPDGDLAVLTTQTLRMPPTDAPAAPAPARRYAVVHPGATTRYKQWALQNFVDVALRLNGQCGLDIVFAGGRTDGPVAAQAAATLTSQGGSGVRVMHGRPLAEVADLVRGATLFIGADSGLAHLARATGTPTVVLFGPSDRKKWGIEDARHRVVCKPQPCAPCFIFGYHRPCREIQCMHRITVESVLASCRELLAPPSSS